MARRARKTAYFLNRTLNRLALIAQGVTLHRGCQHAGRRDLYA